MRPRKKGPVSLAPVLTPLIVATILSTGSPSQAQSDPDPWLGRDKALHFSAAAILAGGTYGIVATQTDARYPALLVGGAVSLGAGAAKEVADVLGLGTPSWRDFAWDVAGTVAGLAVAWGLDLLVRGVSRRHPLLSSPSDVELAGAGHEAVPRAKLPHAFSW